METIRVLQVDAFTTEPLTGNPAGVVPDANGLTADQMQRVARELNLSETAFLLESDVADRRLRYFTPTTEVDLCGHATIGSLAFLADEGRIDPGTSTLETNVGVLEIDLEADGTVWMTQERPTIREVDLEYGRVAGALGIDQSALEAVGVKLPLAVSSTGLPFLMTPVAYLSNVGDADPDLAAVEALSADVDAIGVYLFSFDTLEASSTLHGRAFVPAAGVPEDPVTGTASGAVGAYLEWFGALDGSTTVDAHSPDETVRAIDVPASHDELQLEQGHFVDRPGTVRVRTGDEVRVGGRGVVALDGQLVVPEAEDDDILEV
ncbi:PhzF family phenazine biosynthesis protein [Natronobeatus ordinarius]|uniref:PhzF family phenazine biosynthesis protein n=1 Tax=Natronobeatus ordinarius TaxID=2963433 RepID=UPI0020CDB708|nr:PhzF family phenazine biosynthesis protein [Natronobeatus ordinarius]